MKKRHPWRRRAIKILRILAAIRWGMLFRLLVVVGILCGSIFAANLRVKSVQIEGNTQNSSQDIEEYLLGDKSEVNPLMFWFRSEFSEQKKLPFVESYSVHLNELRNIRIEIHERKFAGYLDAMGTCLYFDGNGYISDSSLQPRQDIPLVTGISSGSLVPGEYIENVDKEIFHMLVNMTGFMQERQIRVNGRAASLVQVIDRIEVDAEGNVTCVFGELSVYMGGRRDMEEKLLEMADILPRLAGHRGTLYLDSYKPTVQDPVYTFRDKDRLEQIEADREAAKQAEASGLLPELDLPGMQVKETEGENTAFEGNDLFHPEEGEPDGEEPVEDGEEAIPEEQENEGDEGAEP